MVKQSDVGVPMAARPVVAFDIDNTLLDPTGGEYSRTLSNFLAALDLGDSGEEALKIYEPFRSQGNALERLGLRNPIHDRGNADALAVFCIAHCANTALQRELAITPGDQHCYRLLIPEVAALDRATGQGSFEQRLVAEREARHFCRTDTRVATLRREAQRIARHPRIVEWARAYRASELAQCVDGTLSFMQSLPLGRVTPVVISEGRSDIQSERLERSALRSLFDGRILISESAFAIPGWRDLEATISRTIDDQIATTSSFLDPDLTFLWYYRCLIDSWATKSPWFYARCLHALHEDTSRPQDSFRTPVYVSAESWSRDPLRFCMVGDRYDKDVEPLTDLLGPGVGMKIRLRMGKYGHLYPEDALPQERRPDKTFTDWDSLAAFLTEELSPDQIKPITTPPDIVNRADIRRDYIERGTESPYEAVRRVARVVTQMIAD